MPDTPPAPSLTLDAVYGPGLTFLGRVSWRDHAFTSRRTPSIPDSYTGTFLTIAGSCPTICSRGALEPRALDLYRAAGLTWATEIIPYGDREEFEAVLRRLAEGGGRLAITHRLMPEDLPDDAHWIPPALLSWLNDKSNLTDLVPAGASPPRRVVPLAEAASISLPPDGIAVLKGATWRSTGSGKAVVIVRSEEELRAAVQRLAGCDRVVVEEYQPFVRTMCVNWAATHTGEIVCIGSADQIVEESGSFVGNWAGDEFAPPREAIELGEEVMRRALALGYRGLAGFDMGLLPDGRTLVFDLNFRSCSSTAGLLWLPWLRARAGGAVAARFGILRGAGDFDAACAVAHEAIVAGWLHPLAALDPRAAGWPEERPIVRGLVLGRDRAEVEARCADLARAGLEF